MVGDSLRRSPRPGRQTWPLPARTKIQEQPERGSDVIADLHRRQCRSHPVVSCLEKSPCHAKRSMKSPEATIVLFVRFCVISWIVLVQAERNTKPDPGYRVTALLRPAWDFAVASPPYLRRRRNLFPLVVIPRNFPIVYSRRSKSTWARTALCVHDEDHNTFERRLTGAIAVR